MGRLTIRIDGEAYIEKVANKYCEEVCSTRNRCNDCPIRDAFNKLAHYEDLEEQGYRMVNIDKVVEQLEAIQNFEMRTGKCYCPDANEEDCRYAFSDLSCAYCSIEKAIEIVKGGAE